MLETQFFSAYLLPASLAFIMLGMGLSLTKKDFVDIFKNPRGLAIGLGAQMIALPLIGFILAFAVPGMAPELRVGIVLVAACPGGATSNLLNYLLNSNLALSLSITTVNSFLTQFTIPLLVNMALLAFMSQEASIVLPFWQTLIQILFITVLPAIAGIYIRSRFPVFAQKVRIPMKYIMTALLGIAIIGAIFLEQKEKLDIPVMQYWGVLPLTVLLNVGGIAAGYYMAKYYKLGQRNQTTIAIEVGLQNTALAIAVATAPRMLNNPSFAIPAAIYALFSFFSTAGFGIYVNRKNINWVKKLNLKRGRRGRLKK